MNKNSFSNAIGLTNNVTIGRIVNENREPSYQVLVKILQCFGSVINAHWLMTGEGGMLIKDTGPINDELPQYYGKDDIMEMQRKYINELEENKELRKEIEAIKTKEKKNTSNNDPGKSRKAS